VYRTPEEAAASSLAKTCHSEMWTDFSKEVKILDIYMKYKFTNMKSLNWPLIKKIFKNKLQANRIHLPPSIGWQDSSFLSLYGQPIHIIWFSFSFASIASHTSPLITGCG
jgi:hypothetical protein